MSDQRDLIHPPKIKIPVDQKSPKYPDSIEANKKRFEILKELYGVKKK